MSKKSNIEWTQFTWNPTTGCTKISPGCKHCYAEIMANRLCAMGVANYKDGFKLTLHPQRLNEPIFRKKPSMYFVNSMSDIFHEDIPFDYIDKVFDTIRQTPQHIYQVLTKRPQIMKEYFSTREVPAHAWIGVSVEDKKYGVPRIDILREIKASVKFLSVEPLLEDLEDINLENIDWVIVGGESGAKARAMQVEWVANIQQQCKIFSVPFFFKQWGAFGADGVRRSKSANGREFMGKVWEEMPQFGQLEFSL